MRAMLVMVALAVLGAAQGDRPPVHLHPTREELQKELLYTLMDRYFVHFDEFRKLGAYDQLDPDREHWFAIVVKAPLYPPLWVKFQIAPGKYGDWCEECGSVHKYFSDAHMKILKGELLRQFEWLLVRHRDDPEIMYSAVHGKGLMYELPTRDSDVTQLRPEHSLYPPQR